VNPEIDRHRHHCNDDNQDDEQRRYLCFSAPDYVKHKRVCDRDDDSGDNKRSQKEIVRKNDLTHHGFTPLTSVLFDSTATACCPVEYSPILYKAVINVLSLRLA